MKETWKKYWKGEIVEGIPKKKMKKENIILGKTNGVTPEGISNRIQDGIRDGESEETLNGQNF